MHSTIGILSALLLVTFTNAHGNHGHGIFRERAKRHVSTITHKSYVTSTVTVPRTIETDIAKTGVYTLIPDTLTITVKALPAYVYIETVVLKTSVVTLQFITTSEITPAKPTSLKSLVDVSTVKPLPSSNTKAPKPSSTSNAPGISTNLPSNIPTNTTNKNKTNTSSASQGKATCCKNNGYTVTKSSQCDGKQEGDTCGSFHTCYKGGCYWFNHDDMCGSFNNACNTDAGYLCANGVCTDVLNDPNNCGLAYRVCGDNDGNPYGCSNGVCVNLINDPKNCGAVGKVCGTGTGCLKGKCIDTTSDDNNCSTPTYKCPTGTKCKDSWCQTI
ncbi:hypothetical protein PVAG01_00163 [Phlyctema vagabunda]|uniref:Antifreeze protein n=1 Tax=Phlyctema vagabunda TaxID=108571 RepID=A0ABR4PTR1_9HELO